MLQSIDQASQPTPTLAELHREEFHVYDAYQRLSKQATARHHARLRYIDPTLPRDMLGLAAHNWHVCARNPNALNRRVTAEVERFQTFSGWLYQRERREVMRARHRDHIRNREVGRYLWCDECQAYSAECIV